MKKFEERDPETMEWTYDDCIMVCETTIAPGGPAVAEMIRRRKRQMLDALEAARQDSGG